MSTNTAARGVIVNMGGRDIRFLPLNWKSLELLQADLDLAAGMDAQQGRQTFFTKDERDAILRIAVVSITRANDDVDEEWVKDNLDLANLGEVLTAVFNTNNFVSVTSETEGAGNASGEAKAAGSEN